jgi:hypothetical protein
MRIGRKEFTISLVLVASLLLPSVTLAQVPAPTGDWAGLKTVVSGSKLVIKLKSGKTVEGKLNSVSEAALSLAVSGKPLDLGREEILRVYQVRGKSAKKPTLIGLGVGAAAGAAIGAAGGENDGFFLTKPEAAAAFSVLGAAVGAITGFAFGKSGHKRILIYEAK